MEIIVTINGKAIISSAAVAIVMLAGASAANAKTDSRAEADKALFEMARGNNWIATNLQKRATAAEPTIENRFNLATGYQRTGRLNTAKTYYQALSTEGDGVRMERGWRGQNFDVAMTSELRKEIADLSRTPPPATDRLEEQKAIAR